MKNVFIDELFIYLDSIKKRKISEALLSLAIVHNPFSEKPNDLFKALSTGVSDSPELDKLDRGGLERLKGNLKKESKFINVK